MIEIVPAQEEHIPRIMELERLCFSPPWSEGSFLSELYSGDSYFAVALCAGQVVGLCVLHRSGDEGELYKIAAAPQYRRHGVGSALLGSALSFAAVTGLARVFLEVRCSNEPAIALYRKFGFKYAGRRKNYYLSPVEDAAVMAAETGNGSVVK